MNGLLNVIPTLSLSGVVSDAEAALEVDVAEADVAEAEVVVEDDDGFEFGALQLIERFISEGRRMRYGPYNPNINISPSLVYIHRYTTADAGREDTHISQEITLLQPLPGRRHTDTRGSRR